MKVFAKFGVVDSNTSEITWGFGSVVFEVNVRSKTFPDNALHGRF